MSEIKKPSEWIHEMVTNPNVVQAFIKDARQAGLGLNEARRNAQREAVLIYLDAEQERRAKFERDVLERLGALESAAGKPE